MCALVYAYICVCYIFIVSARFKSWVDISLRKENAYAPKICPRYLRVGENNQVNFLHIKTKCRYGELLESSYMEQDILVFFYHSINTYVDKSKILLRRISIQICL